MKNSNSSSFTSFSPFPCPNPSCPLFKNSPIVPQKVYEDAAAYKEQIIKDNRGKSGVYLIFFC
jgi:hypothetical protein